MRDNRSRITAVAAFALLTFWVGRSADAQTGGNGTITGKVVDVQGAVLPGVTVTATGGAAKGPRTAITDATGAYRLADLPAGSYAVIVELPGFGKEERLAVVVPAGGTVTVDATLRIGNLSEEVTVTAQRRETNIQTTAVAISAYSGDTLAEEKIFTVTDLANNVPAFSLTAGTPLDVELNVRGVTNTRLDSPTADPSVGTFLDGVYMGRTGDLNFDFYDLERIEVIRGPQGVLLGKNVVGGALSIVTAKPSFQKSGDLLFSYGNYNSLLTSGYFTNRLSDSVAGRFSFNGRKHDGYARDVLHNREVENLTSGQVRGQLLFAPKDSTWTARLVLDYTNDSTDGINVVAVASSQANCEATYLRTNCTRPWSNLRRFLNLTNPRENVAQNVQYAGEGVTEQFMKREGFGTMLDLQKSFDGFSFNSLTGYRDGRGRQLYDQTGAGPEALGWDRARWAAYTAFVAATKPAGGGDNGLFLFAEPVGEDSDIKQFSQEFRLTSTRKDSKVDWIAGVYLKSDEIRKVDHFIGETFLGGPLATLSGETRWDNKGNIKNYAAFGQLGVKFTDRLKLNVGVRYTEDQKDGTVSGLAIATGDRFNPADTRALTPLAATYTAGTGFTDTPYDRSWSKTTPQATLDYTHSSNLFMYATVATGFKGGGFDDTPSNPAQAQKGYNPETVTNYEAGFKATMFDRRVRLNVSGFFMDYKDLQVVQTNAACLCNLTDNAAAAELKGVEGEFEFAPSSHLRFLASGSYVDAKYKDFLETAINPATGKRLDSSGNRLQRTPASQLSLGVDINANLGSWRDAINLRANYAWQGDMKWATDNIASEPAFGLFEARLALAPREKNWEVAFYGKNLEDKLYRVNIIHFFGEEVSQFGSPRTYGVDLRYSFH